MIDIIRSVYSAVFLRRLVDVRLTDVVIILEKSVRYSDKCKPDKDKRLSPPPSPFQCHPNVSITPLVLLIRSDKRDTNIVRTVQQSDLTVWKWSLVIKGCIYKAISPLFYLISI